MTTKGFYFASDFERAVIGCPAKPSEKYAKALEGGKLIKYLLSARFSFNFVSRLSVFWTMIDERKWISLECSRRGGENSN
jgi:hypothetical protein